MHLGTKQLTDFLVKARDDRAAFTVIFCGLAISIFALLVFRNIGLNPGVFADEWIYSSSSRLGDISQSAIPSYLFLLIFENTSRCGGAFLDCARIMNAFLLLLAMPFIYMVARRYANRWASLLIATLTTLGPISSYSAYFMPETLYFLAFWIFAWYTLSARALLAPLRYGVVIGIMLGLMMTIKFHAIFLLTGFCAFVFLCVISRSVQLDGVKATKIAGVAVLTTFLIRFSFGYLAAGEAGLSLTGSFYGNIADSTLDWNKLFELIPLTLSVAMNHLLALSMLFALPIATVLAQVTLARGTDTTEPSLSTTSRLPLLPLVTAMLVVLLGVTSLFSALVTGQTLYELPDRIHMRYYDFLLPLLFIVAAAQLEAPKDAQPRRMRAAFAALLVGALAIYSLVKGMHRFVPNHVDHPDLRGFMAHPAVCIALGCLGLVTLLVWAYRRRKGAQIFVYVFLPLSLLWSSYMVSQIQNARMASDKYDRAGVFSRLYLAGQSDGLVIVGTDASKMTQAQFHIDNSSTRLAYVSERETLTASNIPADATWLLTFDSHDIQLPVYWTVDMGEYQLHRLTPPHTIDFRDSSWPGILGMVEGLSHAEAFGRWSDAGTVQLSLLTPVSGTAQVTLEARAFGPNAGQPFTLALGDQEQGFMLGENLQKVSLTFELPEPTQNIRIVIPQPVSPQELGMSGDGRPLGIALHQLNIQKTADAEGRP